MSHFAKIYSFLWICVVSSFIYSILSYGLFTYTHQIDARKREYYPAIVVDKKYFESCSKSSCSKQYYIVIQRDDNSYEDVLVYQDTYYSSIIGHSISLERHISDPKVYNHYNRYGFIFLSAFFLIIIYFIRRDFK